MEETIKKQYILHFILGSSVNSGGADARRAKINQKIEARDGEIEASICQDASRRFAYPINKQNGGYFCESVFSVSPENIKALSDDLKSEPQIIRYMVELKKPVKFRAKPTRSERYKNTAEAPQHATRPTSPTSKESIDSGARKREKVSMEEIDKKLDEIIKNI